MERHDPRTTKVVWFRQVNVIGCFQLGKHLGDLHLCSNFVPQGSRESDPESKTVGVIMECPVKQDMKIERPRCSTALLSIYKSLIHPFYPSSDLL